MGGLCQSSELEDSIDQHVQQTKIETCDPDNLSPQPCTLTLPGCECHPHDRRSYGWMLTGKRQHSPVRHGPTRAAGFGAKTTVQRLRARVSLSRTSDSVSRSRRRPMAVASRRRRSKAVVNPTPPVRRNSEVSLDLSVNPTPQTYARTGERLIPGFGFALLPCSPRSCHVHAAASFDDDVIRSVGGGDLDHVAVGVDDGTDRCDRGEHRDAGG